MVRTPRSKSLRRSSPSLVSKEELTLCVSCSIQNASMKSNIFTCILLASLPLQAQQQEIFSEEIEQPMPSDSVLQESARPKARTYIPHALEVRPFVPPVPAPPKVLPNVRVDAAVTMKQSNSKTLTILRGEASTLPDIPLPPVVVPTEPRELTADDLARMKYQRRHNLNYGATVYDHKISQIQWTDTETHESYQAICGFDVGLLAGVGRFVHHEETYGFSLMHGDINTTAIRRIARANAYKIPEVPAGEIYITCGNPDDAEAVAPLFIIKDLIATEKSRLEAFQAARQIYAQESAAWYAAHPPIPKDETFLLRPHRGSRYLTNPQPEKQGGRR
jgi:hypothetical protein